MPIEVTPSPSFSLPLPMGLAPNSHPGWSSMHMRAHTGPARAIDILPSLGPASAPAPAPAAPTNGPRHMPGSIMPNGLRNPWAPYAGETYMPSSVAVSAAHHSPPGASVLGGGSVVFPGGSVVSTGSYGDDGWNGTLSRNHNAHAPDFASTATALGPAGVTGANGSLAGWAGSHVPSSWGNHRRMTPTVAAGLAATEILPGSAYTQPHAPAPAMTMHHAGRSQKGEECQECRRRSHSHDHGHGRRLSIRSGRRVSSSSGCRDNCAECAY